jgi:MFS family permease
MSSPGGTADLGAPAPTQPRRIGRTFTALSYRNYRLWFIGQMVSLFGTWMQTTALGFLVFELTRSPAYLGYVGFAAGAPTWLFTLHGGVVSDRVPRRTVLLATQTSMLVLATALAVLTFTGHIRAWHILALACLGGAINAFDGPARQALASDLVDREDLTNAIALNSTMFNAATAVGPAAAGLVYAWFGPAWCFTLNGLSFLAVIGALLLMRLTPPAPARRATSTLSDLREAIAYLVAHPVIPALIGLVGTVSLLGISTTTLMPAWAVSVLHGGPKTNGLLQSARGVGGLSAAMFVASLGRVNFKGRLVTFGSFAYPLLLLVFSFTRWTPLSLVAFAGVGAGTLFVTNLCNALVQTLVPDHLRGRTMGVYTFTFFGAMPIGALWIGVVAQYAGEPQAIIVASALSFVVAGAVWLFAPRVRALA